MSGQFSNGSIWQFPDQFYVWTASAYAEADEAYTWDSGENDWVKIFPNVIEATVANSVNVVAQNLFTTDDWSAPSTKKIIIPAGVTVGSSTISLAALRVGTGAGGPVIFEIAGEVQGAGGAINGGAGGTAMHADAACEVVLTGAIRGGGGGGGKGGNGGGGYYHSTQNEGPTYSPPNYQVSGTYNQYKSFFWGGYLGQTAGNPAALGHGGWTYYQGTTRAYNDGNASNYEIRRSRTLTHYTSGGAGGNGGQGQGYGQSATGGSAGAAGGTNAGAGGTGGSGVGWGSNAPNGGTGAGGNNGGGAGGGTGGAAGTGIHGISNVTLTNNGTINGAQIA